LNNDDDEDCGVIVRDVKGILRLEYCSKFLNHKWTEVIMNQGSSGAYKISQQFTTLIGWSATTISVDDYAFPSPVSCITILAGWAAMTKSVDDYIFDAFLSPVSGIMLAIAGLELTTTRLRYAH